ncbi:hypothetical protein [Schaalia turicensis]|uniref:hypothetical protein n=1 Tax=Schaalia turicensis TaxID=131111 RepID=UPI001C5E9CAE|nr:hypothetical protein [Schaalia turicensis]QYB15750.1 hypothetical protein G5S47_01995 [Schaalia turicensis]
MMTARDQGVDLTIMQATKDHVVTVICSNLDRMIPNPQHRDTGLQLHRTPLRENSMVMSMPAFNPAQRLSTGRACSREKVIHKHQHGGDEGLHR